MLITSTKVKVLFILTSLAQSECRGTPQRRIKFAGLREIFRFLINLSRFSIPSSNLVAKIHQKQTSAFPFFEIPDPFSVFNFLFFDIYSGKWRKKYFSIFLFSKCPEMPNLIKSVTSQKSMRNTAFKTKNKKKHGKQLETFYSPENFPRNFFLIMFKAFKPFHVFRSTNN